MAYNPNHGAYAPNEGYAPDHGYAPNHGGFGTADPHHQGQTHFDGQPYEYNYANTGVMDEKIHSVESEKDGFHEKDLEHGSTRPGYRGKTGDYTVEIAPAGQEQHVHDAVFGDMENGPNYRAVSFVPCLKSRDRVLTV